MHLNFLSDPKFSDGPTLIIMVGPPASGKTTLAKHISSHFDNYKIVSPDEIRKELTGDASNQEKNPEVFDIVYKRLIEYLDDGFNVIYDATNCRTTYRMKIINATKGYYSKLVCICFNTPISICLDMNSKRSRVVPEYVIEKMYFTLHKHAPNIFEGYDIIIKAWD